MNITDAFDAKLEVSSTVSQTPRAAATALAVLLLVAQHHSSAGREELETCNYRNAHSGTHQITIERDINGQDLLNAIVSLHARLLAEQTELDSDSKAAIYSDLWNLYE